MSCENQELKSLYITALILEGGIIGMCTVNLKTALVFGGFGWGQPKPPNTNKFFKSELFSCLKKVDHMVN